MRHRETVRRRHRRSTEEPLRLSCLCVSLFCSLLSVPLCLSLLTSFSFQQGMMYPGMMGMYPGMMMMPQQGMQQPGKKNKKKRRHNDSYMKKKKD